MTVIYELCNVATSYRLLSNHFFLRKTKLDCLVSLVVLSATATLEALVSIPRLSEVILGIFYEILSSSSELGFVPD